MADFTLTEGDDTFPRKSQDNSGNDTVLGLGGNDTILAGAGADLVHGDDGNDRIEVKHRRDGPVLAADSLHGDAGDDTIVISVSQRNPAVTAVGMELSGGDGLDTLEIAGPRYGTDLTGATITGIEALVTNEDVRMTVAQALAFERITFTAYTRLYLTDNADAVFTGFLQVSSIEMSNLGQFLSLKDAEVSGAYDVWITGGEGNDTVYGSNGENRMFLGNGDDVAYAVGGKGTGDELNGWGGNDLLYGSRGNDTLYGDSGNNTLYGGAGDDEIDAGYEQSRGSGGNGNDTLRSGGYDDTLTGGDGADVFVLWEGRVDFADGEEIARITDFTVNPGGGAGFVDRLSLGQYYDNGFRDRVFIGTAEFTAKGQVRVVQDGSDTLVLSNSDADTAAESVIRLVGVDAATITAAEFV